MIKLDEEGKRRIEKQFYRYCENVLENAVRDIYRQKAWKNAWEISLYELTEKELLQMAEKDEMPNFTRFSIEEIMVEIKDEDLAEALEKLSEAERELILQYFFLGKTDEEIAALCHVTRQAITHLRHEVLQRLRKILEEMETGKEGEK